MCGAAGHLRTWRSTARWCYAHIIWGALRVRRGRAPAYLEKHGGEREAEEAFAAVCNARVVKGAEAYYRNMFFRCGPALACRLRLTGVL